MAVFQIEEQVSLKLLVNTETNKVLFAEAGKDFVDILCSFLTLPLGTIARLVQKDSNMGPVTIGCLNSLYQSVENIGLLPINNSSEDYCSTLKINIDDTVPTIYFRCSKDHGHHCPYLSIGTKYIYGRCGNRLNRSVSLAQLCNGFVKGATTFVITDDLFVSPHSINHTLLDLIKNLGMKNTSSVKEMTVNVTKEKVLDLLKCSLLSKTPLTDLFLGKKPSIERLMMQSIISSCDVENIFCSDVQITIKLVVRKSDDNILYALGGNDFANLIINFLTFPLGGVLGRLQGNNSLGSINGLHKSLTTLNEDKYFTSKEAKNRLLELRLLQYYCHHQCDPSDDRIIHVQLYKSDEDWSGGVTFSKMELVTDEDYVKRSQMYLVTDDLVIEPWLSPISSLYLHNRFKTPLDDLEEKVVTIGTEESYSILKAALSSTSALTNGLRHLLT
ncbi:DUF674 family protein [Medicago truncatula]|nr:DUF674 family protein [Medicago truncatula]